jgi:two-component sensor histidine kinase
MRALFILILTTTTALVHGQGIEVLLAGLNTDRQKADTLLYMARKSFRVARFDSAIYYYNKGIPYAEKTGNEELQMNFFLEQANASSFKGSSRLVLVMLDRAIPYMQRNPTYDLHNRYLLQRAKAHRALTQNDSALYYYRACEKVNLEKNPYRNWLVYAEMGQMFQTAEAFQEAEKYYKKSYELTKARGLRMDHGVVLNEFANFYYHCSRTEDFANLVKEHDELFKNVKRDYTKDPVHSLLYLNLKNVPLEKKVEFMKDVKQQLLKGGFVVNGALANNYIAGFYEEAGHYDEALKYISENQELCMIDNNLNNLYVNTNAAYRLLKKAGRDKEAIAVADRLFSLKDSIIRLQQRTLVMELDTKYETDRREKEIDLLNSQNQLHEKNTALLNSRNELNHLQLVREMEMRMALTRENDLMDSVVSREKAYNDALMRENKLKRSELEKEQALKAAASRENILNGNELTREKKLKRILLGGAALLLLSVAMTLFQYKRQLRKNRIIEQQRKDLEVLNREIHHRVKNNLQVISSLLDLQAQTVDDEKTAEKFLEGSQRVQSMAFIHQNLYQGETVDRIDVQRYINVLAEHLLQSYNVDPGKIQLLTDVDAMGLHSDTVIPLGMVINELVSNALKYAFRNQLSGRIDVSLKKAGDKLLLRVKDNGSGIPENIDVAAVNSFGYKIVKAFTQKLKATMTIDREKGTDIQLLISKFRAA